MRTRNPDDAAPSAVEGPLGTSASRPQGDTFRWTQLTSQAGRSVLVDAAQHALDADGLGEVRQEQDQAHDAGNREAVGHGDREIGHELGPGRRRGPDRAQHGERVGERAEEQSRASRLHDVFLGQGSQEALARNGPRSRAAASPRSARGCPSAVTVIRDPARALQDGPGGASRSPGEQIGSEVPLEPVRCERPRASVGQRRGRSPAPPTRSAAARAGSGSPPPAAPAQQLPPGWRRPTARSALRSRGSVRSRTKVRRPLRCCCRRRCAYRHQPHDEGEDRQDERHHGPDDLLLLPWGRRLAPDAPRR